MSNLLQAPQGPPHTVMGIQSEEKTFKKTDGHVKFSCSSAGREEARSTVSSSSSSSTTLLPSRTSGGEAPIMEGLQGSAPGSGVSHSLACAAFRAERSFRPPPGVGVRAGVPPFLSGVLGGRVLSKTSGDRAVPKRTLFFFFTAGVGKHRFYRHKQTEQKSAGFHFILETIRLLSLVEERGTILVKTHNSLFFMS